jgi:hypothetical protein
MSDPTHNPEHPHPGTPPPRGSDAQVEPAADAAPKTVADELFAHGLLTYLNTDTPARQGERIGRLMSELDRDGVPGVGSSPARSSFRFPIRTAGGWLALAACLTIGTIAVFIGIPGEQSAQAVVQQSIEAMRASNGGDRRYEIRLARRAEDALPSLPGAIIDTRSPNLLLLRANAPDGREIITGRDATGGWAIRMDGGIERAHPEAAWPRWAKVGDESLFVDSVDRLLEELTKSYDLQKEGTATLEGKGEVSYRHIVGTKKRHPSPGGDHVEVWIDPTTKSVERLEMRWDLPQQQPGAEGGGPGRGGDNADRPESGGGGPGGPDGPGGPPGLPGPNRRPGFRPDRGPMNGLPGAPVRPQHPPRRDDPGPDGPDGRGPDGPGLDDENGTPGPGLDGPHPRPEPRSEGGPPPRRDDGPRGPMDDQRPGPRGGRPMPPGGPGPRGPGPGIRPMPPRLLVMQRVDAPALEATWFSPETHIAK